MAGGRAFAALAACTLLLAACAPREILVPKGAVVPEGIDLSGVWELQTEGSNERLEAAERRAADAEGILIPPRTDVRRSQSKANRDSLVHVFLETGSRLKITQTAHGLFVSFDRAIVEEYRFGENRTVSVGPIVASRVSGWDAASYVIETLDEEGNKLVERYSLEDDGIRLVRQVAIFRKGTQELSVVQRYERA